MLCVGNNGRFLEQTFNTKFLGLKIDKCLNWKEHIAYIILKLSSACYDITSMSTFVCIRTLKLIYFAYFHSLMKYGLYFGVTQLRVKSFSLQKKQLQQSGSGKDAYFFVVSYSATRERHALVYVISKTVVGLRSRNNSSCSVVLL